MYDRITLYFPTADFAYVETYCVEYEATVNKTGFSGLLSSLELNRGVSVHTAGGGHPPPTGLLWWNLVVQKNERITPNVTTARSTNPQRFISRLGSFFSPIQSSNQAVSFRLNYTSQA